MKVTYVSENGRLTFDVEAETAKALFSQLGSIQELFEAEKKCGMCQSPDIRYSARKVDDFEFYELECKACRARFGFGQKKKGGELFPKRKDEDGNWLPNNGWSRFQPKGHESGGGTAADWRDAAPSAPPPAKFAGPTPAGLQPSFDRLGTMFDRPAPMHIGPALDMIREEFHKAAGKSGTSEFDETYRKFESIPGGKTDAGKIKGLLRELVTSLDRLKQEVHG